jgi:hypothetical protein
MSKFKVGDKVFYRGNRCRVIGIQEPSYALQIEGVEGEDGRIPRADEHEIQSPPAETPYERRGRDFAKKLREAVRKYDSNATFFVGNKGDAWLEGCSDLAAELAPHELTDEDVERAAIAYVNERAKHGEPTWQNSSESLHINVRGYMRAALTAIGALPTHYVIGVDMAAPGGDYTAKREATQDEVERVKDALIQSERNQGSSLVNSDDYYRVNARAAIAAMSPPEPLTVSTISETELAKELRKVGAGIDTKFYWECVAHKARELLCKDAVQVDFVVMTLRTAPIRIGITPISNRAKKAWLIPVAEYDDVHGAASCVADLQHRGYTILVR